MPPSIHLGTVLYLVSTPIGHLDDLSYRAVAVLKSCHYVLCEDTRHSRHLLDHFAISTPLRAFHQFNEAKAEEKIIEDLKKGATLALISDAGTPLISDPGHKLVVRCRAESIPVSAIPGPCAVIDALVLSGLPSAPFQFLGFLPKKQKECEAVLARALLYPGTTIAYESPHRIEKTLTILLEQEPKRNLCIARELTKLHEECLFGIAEELILHFKNHPPRGEMVLLLSPSDAPVCYEHLSLQELVALLQQDLHLTKNEAIKTAAQMRHLPKKEVYKHFTND